MKNQDSFASKTIEIFIEESKFHVHFNVYQGLELSQFTTENKETVHYILEQERNLLQINHPGKLQGVRIQDCQNAIEWTMCL